MGANIRLGSYAVVTRGMVCFAGMKQSERVASLVSWYRKSETDSYQLTAASYQHLVTLSPVSTALTLSVVVSC